MSVSIIIFVTSSLLALVIGCRFAKPAADDLELRWFDRLLAMVFIVCILAAPLSASVLLTQLSLKVM